MNMSDAKTSLGSPLSSSAHNIQFVTSESTGLFSSTSPPTSQDFFDSDVELSTNTWFKTFLESLSAWLVGQENGEDEEIPDSQDDSLPASLVLASTNESILAEDSFERLDPSLSVASTSTSSSLSVFDHDYAADPIWSQWEWILSKAEEFAMKRSEQGLQELSQLRERANKLRAKPQFAEHAKEILEQQSKLFSADDWQRLTYYILDSSKRAHLITDVVKTFSPKWLRFIKRVFFNHLAPNFWQTFEESFHESQYQKGLVGGLKEVGWQASHGPGNVGLTHTVLGDIIWSFWNTLVSGITWVLHRELTREEQNAIAEQVADCQGHLITLWLNTVKQSSLGTSQAGRVVKRFAEEEKKKKVKLEAVKKQGVTAKYELKRTVVLESEKKPIGELRKMLESQLQFKV